MPRRSGSAFLPVGWSPPFCLGRSTTQMTCACMMARLCWACNWPAPSSCLRSVTESDSRRYTSWSKCTVVLVASSCGCRESLQSPHLLHRSSLAAGRCLSLAPDAPAAPSFRRACRPPSPCNAVPERCPLPWRAPQQQPQCGSSWPPRSIVGASLFHRPASQAARGGEGARWVAAGPAQTGGAGLVGGGRQRRCGAVLASTPPASPGTRAPSMSLQPTMTTTRTLRRGWRP